ncbi:iron chaperone [Lacicoccus qingdaonensis]|uniref:YdhG-like domain-containing protein n=1 Tax=Lacicoccus qingdaonensis TaxID=576118 RepID=A0A1G9BPI1_9BACL|nr:DUF1801 domain-containing protein [Salinicoccus qingdaonensis]SDK41054.1 hypothetical protein SAMN05216216_10348 [Salinicoccus qingdaonensis]
MKTFQDYIETIDDMTHRRQFEEVIEWINKNYPDLDRVIKWNSPMYTMDDTFILGIDSAKKHMSISPEGKTMGIFKEEVEQAGYSQTNGLFRIKYSETVDYDLLKKMIDYNVEDKKGYEKFWR